MYSNPLLGMQFEIESAKNIACVSFLVLTATLVVYVTILLFDKAMTIGRAFGTITSILIISLKSNKR